MSGEIRGVRTSDGVTHSIDYQSLANKPSIPVIPSHGTDDRGSVLSVATNDSLVWRTPESGLPELSGDDNKVLVATGCDGNPTPQWGDVNGDVLPSWDTYTCSCALMTDSSGVDLEWVEIRGLPSSSLDNYQCALVVNGSGEPMWSEDPMTPLPSWDSLDYSEDEGKVLTVNDCGVLVWDGTVVPACDTQGFDNGKVLSVNGSSVVWRMVLPDLSGASDGDMLVVGSTGDALKWASFEDAFVAEDNWPVVGDFLRVYSTGDGTKFEFSSFDEILPSHSSDIGEFLVACTNGEVAFSHVFPFPEYGEIGDIMCVYGSDVADWEHLNGGVLPAWSTAMSDNPDAGKVLSVSSSGQLQWTSLS